MLKISKLIENLQEAKDVYDQISKQFNQGTSKYKRLNFDKMFIYLYDAKRKKTELLSFGDSFVQNSNDFEKDFDMPMKLILVPNYSNNTRKAITFGEFQKVLKNIMKSEGDIEVVMAISQDDWLDGGEEIPFDAVTLKAPKYGVDDTTWSPMIY